MKTAVYDNPHTCCREGWRDGKLVFSYSLNLMMSTHWPPPARLLHMGANVGKWEEGRVLGDADAIGGVYVV
jgi:hypothetical protein